MEGIGLDNMLGAEQVEKLFSNPSKEITPEEAQEDKEQKAQEHIEDNNETAEVDFSDLLGNKSEEVGSERDTEGNGETPESKNDIGAPNSNLFSSIAKALRDEGVFPDLSDDTLNDIKDAAAFRKLFDDEIANSLTERQKRIEQAIHGGATKEEVQGYNNDMSVVEFLEAKETLEKLENDSEEGETLRKQIMYQDYINRGFKPERAQKLVQKSVDDGNDIDDAKEALQSCKEFYKQRIDDYQEEFKSRQESHKKEEEKQYNNLKKQIVDTEEFFGGVKVDKNTRQKAYDCLTKPTYKDENGNYLTALQRYQRENPFEFMKNVALMYSLTDGFKNVDKLTRSKVNAGLKKGFAELESTLNNTRRNFDGTLNFANSAPDDEEREKWTLAI